MSTRDETIENKLKSIDKNIGRSLSNIKPVFVDSNNPFDYSAHNHYGLTCVLLQDDTNINNSGTTIDNAFNMSAVTGVNLKAGIEIIGEIKHLSLSSGLAVVYVPET